MEDRKNMSNRNVKSVRRSYDRRASNSINKARGDKNKRMFIFKIVLICLVCFLAVFGLFKLFNSFPKETDDNLIYNKNKSFIKHQKIKGIAFKDINCTYDGKNSLITYTIINETKKDIYLSNYDVIIRDKDKQIITKIVASYSENIPPRKKISMANSVIGMNLTNAYYMELKLKTGKK